MEEKKKCYYCGSTHKVTNYLNKGVYVCNKHRSQIREYGKVILSRNDPNVIRIYEDYAEFDTRDKYGNTNGTFIIDLDMVDFIKVNKMHKHYSGYACYKMKKDGKTINIRLHRYIMNVHNESPNIIVDHINQNKSDNRKCNLRLTTYEGNGRNVKEYSHNTSGHKGISWSKRDSCWEVYIHRHNKKISLGLYHDFNRAIYIREIAELVFFGEYSSQYEYLCNKYNKDKYIKYMESFKDLKEQEYNIKKCREVKNDR